MFKIAVGIIAFPLMGIGLVGVSLWFMVDRDCSPIVPTKEQPQ